MAAVIAQACFLCLVISSVFLTLPGRAECAATDPDDDSWSASDSVGLSGGVRWATESGVSHEAPSGGASIAGDRRDDAPLVDNESEGSRDSQGDKGFDSSDFSTDKSDIGAGESDIGVGEIDIDVNMSVIGVDETDIGVGESDIKEGDDVVDDVEFGVSNAKDSFDDDDYDFDDSELDFDNSDLDFKGSVYEFDDGFDDGNYEYAYNDYEFDDNDFDDSDYEHDYSDYEFDDNDYSDYEFDDNDNIDYDFEDNDYSDYEDVRSDFGYRGPDFDFEDDTDYGYGGEIYDPYDRFGKGYGHDDSARDYDPEGDSDDDFGDFSFGSRRRSEQRRQRRGGRRHGHRDRVRTLSARPARRAITDGEDGADIEIDDASAHPEDIPRGYFEREGPQRSRMAPATSGSIDFPGFRLIIREGNDWWKFNENVCLSKEFLRPMEMEEDTDISMYTVKCSGPSLTEYSCNVTEWNGTVSASYRLTYTCCRGFTRLRADRGCPRRIPRSPTNNLSFVALLRKHGYSQRIIDLFGTVLSNDTRKQWTVFVPPKGALDDVLRMVNFREAIEEPVPEWFVRTMLNHFVQPARTTGSLRADQVLPTLSKTGGGLLITKTKPGGLLVNCRPIQKANQPFNQYSLVHFTSSVLTLHQGNLYQLILKRLESVISLETAKKLLAPLKSILSGARPVTVFMHTPSKDETDNNCYARNLRAAIVNGAECNSSLSTGEPLRTVDGKILSIAKFGKNVVIGSNRIMVKSDLLASNGVLHIVRATESLTGFENEVTRRLKSSDLFKPLFDKPGRTEGSLALLIPPNNGSYSYANTSARWNNATELAMFGRRHMLDNATALMERTVRLAMLDGTQRDFVQLLTRQASTSIFGSDRAVRHRFVDCVRIVQMTKNCGGNVYLFLKRALPDFLASPTAKNYLNSSTAIRSYRVVRSILNFALARNVTDLASRLRQEDAALVLLNDADMHRLSGELMARRRPPTAEQMLKLTSWFARYFVASKQICAVKSLAPYVTVPVLQFERRPCRSVICAFRRQVSSELKRIQLRPDSHVTVREGFLLPGKLVQ